MKKFKILLIFSLFLHLTTLFAESTTKSNKSSEELLIWAHADIQPQSKEEYSHYEVAVNDMVKNLPKMDMALLAGDIVQRHESDGDYQWFLKTRAKAGIDHWFEIVGNHDARNFGNYFKYIQKPLYYSVTVGNVLMLFVSDEINNSPQIVSDSTFEWWKEQVIKNQDKTIITITHAYLKESKLFGYRFYRSNIIRSERFAEVLKKYRVDIWLAGHTSAPSSLGYNESRIKELNNTLFINISAIRREFGINVESRIFFFKQNSNKLIIKMRDHDNQEYVKSREIILKLKQPFKFKSRVPIINYPAGVIY